MNEVDHDTLLNIFLWILLYLLFSTFEYFAGVKSDWQKLRIRRGLDNNENNNAPKLMSKSIFGKRIYLSICINLYLKTLLLSLIIFMGFILLTPEYNLLKISIFIKTVIALLLIFVLFLGITSEKEGNIDNLFGANFGLIKQTFNFFIKIKEHFLNTAINKEETYLRTEFENTFINWYSTHHEKKDEIGIFIVRLYDFLEDILPSNIESDLRNKINITLYDICLSYIEDDDSYILEKLIYFINNVLIKKAKIKIIYIALLIRYQRVTQISKRKVKLKVKEYIKSLEESIVIN
mgnify:CR=1 FL=1